MAKKTKASVTHAARRPVPFARSSVSTIFFALSQAPKKLPKEPRIVYDEAAHYTAAELVALSDTMTVRSVTAHIGTMLDEAKRTLVRSSYLELLSGIVEAVQKRLDAVEGEIGAEHHEAD